MVDALFEALGFKRIAKITANVIEPEMFMESQIRGHIIDEIESVAGLREDLKDKYPELFKGAKP